MICECCGEEHGDNLTLLAECIAHLVKWEGSSLQSIAQARTLIRLRQEFEAAYPCLYDEWLGGGE